MSESKCFISPNICKLLCLISSKFQLQHSKNVGATRVDPQRIESKKIIYLIFHYYSRWVGRGPEASEITLRLTLPRLVELKLINNAINSVHIGQCTSSLGRKNGNIYKSSWSWFCINVNEHFDMTDSTHKMSILYPMY